MLTHKRQLLKNAILVFLLVSILGGVLIAQSLRKQRGPRAIGIVEVAPKGRARLVPVGILVDGKWYDAGIYLANPRPMALDPETVYEAQKTGTPQGLFTVNAAQEIGGNWVGIGTWKPSSDEQAAPKKVVDEKKPQSSYPEDDDAPPVLRRPGSAKPAGTSAPSQPPSTLPPSQAAEEQKKTSAAGDTAQSSRNAEPEDPNRPVLRRGKPSQEHTDDVEIATGSSSKTTGTKAPTPAPVLVDTYAAISDATPTEPRSFTISLNPAEREQHARRMMELASEAIRNFAVTHPIRGRQAPSVALVDVQARDFDVNGSNDPVLVFSARAPETPAAATPPKASASSQRIGGRGTKAAQTALPTASTPTQPTPPPPGAGFEYYVTVVARVDVNGEVRKLFDSVTDSSHLDAIPRLQFIDCVDADGNRVGDLLFREVFDRSRAYIIYRVGMDKLWEVFQTAQMSGGR